MAADETKPVVTPEATSGSLPPAAATPDLSALSKWFFGPRAISTVAITGIFLLGLVAFLYYAKPFLMPVLLALLLNFVLRPVVRGLTRVHIPQPVGAGLVIAVFIGLATVAVMSLKQPALNWLKKAPDSLEMLQMKVREVAQSTERFTHLAHWLDPMPEELGGQNKNLIDVKSLNVAGNVVSYTTSVLVGALEMIVLLYFLLAAGDVFLQKAVRVMPGATEKKEAVKLSRDMEHTISTYLFTITFVNAGVAVVVALAMSLVGLPNPPLWGAVAGLLNFIPYFGPFVMTLVLVLAGLLSFESAGRALVPAVVYLAVHATESNLITPAILGRRLTLSPVAIFVSIMFWTWLWGIPGALLSVPLLMTLKIICDHVKPLAPFGEFLSG